jgi:hypothetical protein
VIEAPIYAALQTLRVLDRQSVPLTLDGTRTLYVLITVRALLFSLLLFAGTAPSLYAYSLISGDSRRLSPGVVVAVDGAGSPVAAAGPEGTLAFWRDPRAAASWFYSTDPISSAQLVGTPLPQLESAGDGILMVVPHSTGFLAIAHARAAEAGEAGFFALTFDRHGSPLESEPRRIWRTNHGLSSARLVSNGHDILLLWIEGYSLRTLQLAADGTPLEWSAPAEAFAGRLDSLAAAVAGERYLLTLSVRGSGDSKSLYSLPLSKEGQPLSPSKHLFDVDRTPVLRMAGGESSALLLWSAGGVHAARIDREGNRGPQQQLVPPSQPVNPASLGAHRSGAGWEVFWSDLAQPSILAMVQIDPDGMPGSRSEIAPWRLITAARSAEGSGSLLMLQTFDEAARAHHVEFLDRHGGEWRHSVVSSFEPQRLLAAAGSQSQALVAWSSRRAAQAHLIDRNGSRPTAFHSETLEPLDVASDGALFLIGARGERRATSSDLHALLIDPSGALIDSSIITHEFFFTLKLAGNEDGFLAYWSDARPWRLRLIPGNIHVASLTRQTTAVARLFWPAEHTASMSDLICADRRCFAVWNETDLSGYHDFVPSLPGQTFGARVSRTGDLPGSPRVLAEEAREGRLATAGENLVLFEVADGIVSARVLDWDGQTIVSSFITRLQREARIDAASAGLLALVVWEAAGDIFGRMVDAEGAIGPLLRLAATDAAETNPLVVTGPEGSVWLIYELTSAETTWVSQIVYRELRPAPPRLRPAVR